jgi:hypothetical protein
VCLFGDVSILREHSHYSQEVQEAVLVFQDAWKSYSNLTWLQLKENAFRIDAVQSAWDRLARARKRETSTGFYLNKKEYAAALCSK